MPSKSILWRTSLASGVVFAGLVMLVFGAAAYAAESPASSDKREEITLSPAVSELTVEPGEMQSGEFTVLNTGDKEFSYIVYARPYSVDTEAYQPNYSDTPARSNLYRWVQFDVTEGKLAPGEEQKINYTILVPDDAEAGGHYGVLFAETVADEAEGQVIARNKRVGSIVQLAVGGDVERSGKVESQTIPWLQTKPPLSTEVIVNNQGNIDFDATITTRVTTIFGREIYQATNDYVIYPDKPRRINPHWEGAPALGLLRVEQTVEVLGNEQLVTGYVLMIPRWALIVLLMSLIGGGVYVAYRRLR